MTKEEAQLRDPKIGLMIVESIAKEIVFGVFSRLEQTCFAHDPADQYIVDGQPVTTLIHREIRSKPTVKDKDLAVKAFIDDILEHKIVNFIRLPHPMYGLSSRVEGNGIVVRCSIELYPELRIVLDYAGWT